MRLNNEASPDQEANRLVHASTNTMAGGAAYAISVPTTLKRSCAIGIRVVTNISTSLELIDCYWEPWRTLANAFFARYELEIPTNRVWPLLSPSTATLRAKH